MTPARIPIPEPALEGAVGDGAAVALREGSAGRSPLEELLAKGRLRAPCRCSGRRSWRRSPTSTARLANYPSDQAGVVTDRSLPEVVPRALPRPVTWGMWLRPRSWPWRPTSRSFWAPRSG